MGFYSDVANRVREFFRSDKEGLALRLAKGSTSSGYPASGFDLLQAYGYDVLSDYLKLEHDLLSRFVDYEEMSEYPEISSALDIYADDGTQTDSQLNRSVWVESPDDNVQRLLDDLLHRTLRLDEDAWGISRYTCQYGNDYEEILVTQNGVEGLNHLPAPTVRRIEGPRGELFGFIQDFRGKFGYSPQEFQQILAARSAMRQSGDFQKSGVQGLENVAALEDWEVVHFRLHGAHRRSIYGFGVLEAARWIWKRLMLLEDSALIYRLQRAPERFAFYIDTGDLPPAESLAYVNRVRQQFKKQKFLDPTTGKLNLKANFLAQDEDFFIPTRKGQDGARIEVLGAPNWQHVEDIEYFRDKLFAALKVPKAYMAQEEGVNRGVLSSADVRFARTVLRVQRELRNGFGKICRVHLAALNIDPFSVDYDIRMPSPSSIFELAQMEVRNARADLAQRMGQFVSLHWILSNVFGFNDRDIETIIDQRKEDVRRDSMAQAQAEAEVQMLQQKVAAAQTPPPPQPGQVSPEQDQTAQQQQQQQQQQAAEQALRSMALPRRRSRSPLIVPATTLFQASRPLTEYELFAGKNRESEKRAADKLERLLKNDKSTAIHLMELRSLLQELKASVSSSR